MKKILSRIPWDFFVLSFTLVLIHIPILPRSVWYAGDTAVTFQMFYAFYNHFFWHHDLIRWLPYGSFGIQSDYYQLIYLSPFQYAAGLVGAFFHIRDVSFLFKFSVLLEMFAFLAGSYLFACRIFKNKAARFFTCLNLLTGCLWLAGIFWNFRMAYLFPLILYFLHRFFHEKKGEFFWTAGLTFVVSQWGVPPYFAGLQFLILALIVVFGFWGYHGAFLSLAERSRRNLVPAAALVLIACLYLYFALHMFHYVLSHVHGRGMGSFAVPLEAFLTHGADIGWEKFLGFFYPNWIRETTSLYVGILTLPFVLYALFHVRQSLAIIFALVAVFLGCFSLGDATPVAGLCYKLYPPIRFFRYLGFMGGILRLFLILLAGYGLDQYLRDLGCRENGQDTRRPRYFLLLYGVLIFAVGCLAGFLNRDRPFSSGEHRWIFYSAWILGGVGLVMLARERKNIKRLGWIAVVFLAGDLFLFQALFQCSWLLKWDWISRETVEVYPYQFQTHRGLVRNLNPRMTNAWKVIYFFQREGAEKEVDNFILFDACLPREFLNSNWNDGVMALIFLRYKEFFETSQMGTFVRRPAAREFFEVFGCREPKARLISDAAFAKSKTHALKLVSTLEDINRQMVLETNRSTVAETWNAGLSGPALGEITARKFSFNEFLARAVVNDPKGAWLYYADAFHPGWRAYVDGKRAEIARTNLAFKAVYLKEGKHAVRFVFWNGFQSLVGYFIALFSILFLIGLGVFLWVLFCKHVRPRATGKIGSPSETSGS